ncbi:MarR family transcriptional regulator [Paenibacillus filicis]|uniref:MarR family transcriptional regulator n=1 Tax=Paenibacillus gyeongsangnamensis TaxID=3388067 RepID=A0ABT4Q793_9BACL|nr:MarR family transcriptional regulator [Paenibacillus filicis]MCZ8512701.1 MarR family transcriptional regulator [Paenibacillus filicis]
MEPSNRVDLLEQMHRLIYKRIFSEWSHMSPLHLTMPQANLLKFLDSKAMHKTSDAADFMCISSGALTMLCDKLAEKGLIERNRDEADRRVIYLELSEEGKRVVQEIRMLKGRLIDRLMEGVTEDDLQALNRVYSCFAANLAKMQEQRPVWGGTPALQEMQ